MRMSRFHARLPLIAAAALTPLAGCLDHHRTGFKDADPPARFRAIEAAATDRDQSSIPSLITALLSDDPMERFLAIHTLERLTGQTLGYQHSAPRAERLAGAERWQAWYASHKSDPPPSAIPNARTDSPSRGGTEEDGS